MGVSRSNKRVARKKDLHALYKILDVNSPEMTSTSGLLWAEDAGAAALVLVGGLLVCIGLHPQPFLHQHTYGPHIGYIYGSRAAISTPDCQCRSNRVAVRNVSPLCNITHIVSSSQ